MARNNTVIIERKGVNAVDSAFLDMGWVFRETPHTDYGIDGDVEIRKNGELTGKHLALQIKSGDSYLKENKNGKITFYIDEWHYKYWLQYDRPVIILFYDDQSSNVIWEQVRLANIQNTTKQFKIEICPSKTLSRESIDEMQNIVEAYEPHKIFQLNKACLTDEYLKYCNCELSRTIDSCLSDNKRFNEIIEQLCVKPNYAVLQSAITHFTQRLQFYNALNYEVMHKSSWILNAMSLNIPHEVFLPHNMAVNSIIATIDGYITILNTIRKTMSLLQSHHKTPEDIKQESKRSILIIDDGIAAFNLVRKDYEECINNVKKREERQLPPHNENN